ncbi:hypothetical protein HNQ71_001312 [Mesorhizobium sangaii]|uniref:Uncharacterized protein n=1 Tax=Mesorhizobium sangaii TaxID=505389 RepID=A0A841P753_9HYPH|nr:hypothetical protein [Mesorhizobium sangaii]
MGQRGHSQGAAPRGEPAVKPGPKRLIWGGKQDPPAGMLTWEK